MLMNINLFGLPLSILDRNLPARYPLHTNGNLPASRLLSLDTDAVTWPYTVARAYGGSLNERDCAVRNAQRGDDEGHFLSTGVHHPHPLVLHLIRGRYNRHGGWCPENHQRGHNSTGAHTIFHPIQAESKTRFGMK